MSARNPPATYRTSTGGTIHAETTNPTLLALLRENSQSGTNTSTTAAHNAHTSASQTPVAPAHTDDFVADSLDAEDAGTPVKSPAPASARSVAKPPSAQASAGHSQHSVETFRHPGEPASTYRAHEREPSNPPQQTQPQDHGGNIEEPLPRSVSQYAQREDESVNFQGEESEKQSLAVTLVSRDLPSDSDSASSELARLVGTPSRKSLAFSTTVTEHSSPQGQGQGQGDFDGEGEEGEVTPTPGKGGEATLAAGEEEGEATPTPRAQKSEKKEETEGHQTPFTSRAAPDQSPLPATGRSSITAVANPLVVRGTIPPSPDLQNPQHERFVTPYASRRLKDRPLGRNSAVGGLQGVTESGDRAQVTQHVPKDQSWSANQAARLRGQQAGGDRVQKEVEEERDTNNNGVGQSTLAPEQASSEHHQFRNVHQEPRESEVDHFEPVETLHVPQVKREHRAYSRSPSTPPEFESGDKIDISVPASPSQSKTDVKSGPISKDLEGGDGVQQTAKTDHSPISREPKESESASTLKPPPALKQSNNNTSASNAQQQGSRDITPSNSRLVASAAEKVYIESPTFTQEEEEQYRFVSSRVDRYEEADTYRGLDEGTVVMMEGGAAVGVRPTRKPFKQVRYQDDEERFEDREDILRYRAAEGQRRGVRGQDLDEDSTPVPLQKQYVLKPKQGSASKGHSSAQPVKGLVLPSGPSWDPGDEEDLRRETDYQQELRHRITDNQRRAEETVIPPLPLGVGESEDFMRDSLDVPEDIALDSERYNVHRDSLDMYEQQRLQRAMRNTQWEDPPAPPPRTQFAPTHPHMARGGPNMGAAGPNGYMNNYRQQPMMDAEYTARDGGQYAAGVDYEGQYGYGSNPAQQRRPEPHGYAQTPPPQMRADAFGQRPNPAQYAQQEGGYYAQAPPQGYYGQNPQQQPQDRMPMSQQQYMSEVDPAYQRPNQAARPGHYMERSPGQNIQAGSSAELREGFYLTEPRGYAPGPGAGGAYGQNFDTNVDDGTQTLYSNQMLDTDRYQSADDLAQMSDRKDKMSLEPEKPSYDYVSNNKVDYGRTPKRTYKKIHEVQKEEKEKLTHVFIQPKVKGKDGKTSHRASRDSSPSRYPAITEHPVDEGPGDQLNMGAEQLWAQRSATLAQAKNPQMKRKKQNSNTSLQSNVNPRQFQSESSLSSAQINNQQLVPVSQFSGQPTPMQSPPVRRPVELKPITQEIITEDGQRISVDVNLRLISPPLGQHLEENFSPGLSGQGQGQGQGRHQPGYQYPVEDVTNGQHPYSAQDETDYRQGRYSADDVLSSKNHGGYASDTNYDYAPGTYTTNPYKKIPPIGGENDAPRSAPVQSEGSYMLSYLREKEKSVKGDKPWYRVYGMKDYKRMQKEVRLGTLGPDLDNDTYKEKREKMLRQTEYAKAVKAKNTQELLSRKPPAFPRPKEKDDIMSKHKLAKEYSRNVPKPTVRPKPSPFNSYELASQLSPIAKSPAKGHQSKSPAHEPSVEVLDLQKLHERHEQDKRSAALIRQKAEGIIT